MSAEQIGFQRILSALAAEEAQVILIGGLAAVLHGVPYVTNDIDFVYALTDDNRGRLLRALTPLRPRLRVAGMSDEGACSHGEFRYTHLIKVGIRVDMVENM